MKHAKLICTLCAAALGAAACHASGGSLQPTVHDGPFAMTFGAQERDFSIDPDDEGVTVKCTHKPGLKEFEYDARGLGPDGKSSINIKLRGFDPSVKKLDVKYEQSSPTGGHLFDIKLSGGYEYVLFQNTNPNTNETLVSKCSLELDNDGQEVDKSEGAMYCTMLPADFDSKDYTPGLNAWIDLVMSFACEGEGTS